MEENQIVSEEKEVCEICGKEATAIIRCKNVCQLCYSILVKDNFRLFKKDKDIPNDISYLKSCKKYNCPNKFLSTVKYENGQIVPEYCSEKCKLLDIEINLRRTWPKKEVTL